MFRTNPLKAKLARGEPTLGAWSTWTHAASIELMAMAGYDAIIIDHEHGLGGLAETQSCLQALSAHPTAGLVRIPSADPIYIKRILDIGVEGIMVPGVEDAETARAMVAACRYPPHGTRGSAYGIARASNYGLAAERYRDTSAAELLIIAQIESVAGVLAVDEIAAVDGIDMLFVGPFDLSGSLGKLGRFDDREVRDTIAKAEAAIRDRDDVWFGALPSLDRSAADMVAEGVQFVANRSDGTLMRDAAVADVGDFRTALKGDGAAVSGGRHGAADDGSAPADWGGGLEILTTGEMGEADRRTIAGGTPGIHLMERAGLAIAEAVATRWTVRPVTVLCGPGNNGGDGYVAARRLADWGWPVTLAQLGDPARLQGDAAIAAARWTGPVEADGIAALAGAGLAIDALFGAGLARPLDGRAADWVRALADSGLPVVAVDMPSGVDGDSGAVKGVACAAALTVTFARRKIGHVIGEGLMLSGPVVVADIGIPDAVVASVAGPIRLNDPALWRAWLPQRRRSDHKYSRGHLLLHAGAMAGAAVLAASAARRVGAGLVTVLTDAERTASALVSYAPGTIVAAEARWPELLADPRMSPVLIGPGAGRSEATRTAVIEAAGSGKPLVLDADALTVFQGEGEALFGLVDADDVLTPHAGEFDRLFGRPDAGAAGADKIARTRAAAALAGAVVLHKGPDTVIAAADGRVVVETSGPPSLATAGSGDVLAGIIAGLISQGMAPFSAAAAAARLHAVAARNCVKNLVAEDLVTALGDIDSQIVH